jgi:hypothetical protein
MQLLPRRRTPDPFCAAGEVWIGRSCTNADAFLQLKVPKQFRVSHGTDGFEPGVFVHNIAARSLVSHNDPLRASEVIKNFVEHPRSEGMVEECKNVSFGKFKPGCIRADDLGGYVEPFEIGHSDFTKFGRVIDANQLCKIALRRDDERPALPATNVDECKLLRVDPAVCDGPLTPSWGAGFVTSAVYKVLTSWTSTPNDTGSLDMKRFVEWFPGALRLWKASGGNLKRAPDNPDGKIIKCVHPIFFDDLKIPWCEYKRSIACHCTSTAADESSRRAQQRPPQLPHFSFLPIGAGPRQKSRDGDCETTPVSPRQTVEFPACGRGVFRQSWAVCVDGSRRSRKPMQWQREWPPRKMQPRSFCICRTIYRRSLGPESRQRPTP